MKIIWDEAKRRTNLSKHGLDFVQVAQLFYQEATLTFEDTRFDYGEERFITIGFVDALLITAVYTYPGGDQIRLISARRATAYEKHLFNTI